jgi:putative DNA primase/helicase
MVAVDSLIPYAGNARTHSEDQVAHEKKGLSGAGVLTFVGEQGVGKTRAFKDLTADLPEIFHEGATLDPSNKDSVISSISHWIVELGELDSTFKKSEISQLKAFLTRDTDVVRRPYAKRDSTYPRRTVFAGTVNEYQFLHDTTGNRRFWPIEITQVKREKIQSKVHSLLCLIPSVLQTLQR